MNVSNNRSKTPKKRPNKTLDIIEEKPTTSKKAKNLNNSLMKKKMSTIIT